MINNQVQNHTNFKGIPIARVIPHNSGKEITLYELTKNDIPFAKKMVEKLDLKALHPNLDDYSGFPTWKTIIKRAVERIGTQPVFLAVQNNRPCGIMAYRNIGEKTSFLSALATWPTKPNETAEHAGKALMRKLFQFSHQEENKIIRLNPSKSKPRNKSCEDFYSKLGFTEASHNEHLQAIWELKDTRFDRKYTQLDNFFEYKEILDGQEQNLEKKLTLKTSDTLSEKIAKFLKIS